MNTHVIAVDVVGRDLGHRRLELLAEAPLELRLEPVHRPAMVQEEELETGLLAILSKDIAVTEDLRDALDHREGLPPRHERVEPLGEMRIGGEPAAHPHRKAGQAGVRVAHRRQTDIVDLRVRAPDAAAGDGHLELARQVVELRAAVEHGGGGLDERRGVGNLVGVHARHRAAGDVPGDVATGSQGADADLRQALDDGGQILDPYPVELYVLAHCDVGHAAGEPLREIGDARSLARGQDAVGNADAHEEMTHRLALATRSPTAPTPSPCV